MNAGDQKKVRIEAIVTELEKVGLQGAYPLAETILKAISEADKKHILELWNELGVLGMAAMQEWIDSKTS